MRSRVASIRFRLLVTAPEREGWQALISGLKTEDAALEIAICSIEAPPTQESAIEGVSAILWVGHRAKVPPGCYGLPWELMLYKAGTLPAADALEDRLTALLTRLDARRAKDYSPPLKEMLDAAADGWMFLDEHLVLRYCNPALARMIGRPLDELIGLPANKMTKLSVADDDKARDALLIALSGERAEAIELVLTSADDGKTITVEAVARHVKGPRPQVIATLRDISQRTAAQRALRESEERFERLASLSSEGIVIHENGRILDVNDALAEIVGNTREELVGSTVFEWVANTDHHVIEAMADPDIRAPFTAHIVTSTGEPRVLEGRTRDLPGGKGRERVAILKDVTIEAREREQRDLAQFVLQGTGGVLIRWSPDDGAPIIWVSDQIKLFGYEPKQLMRDRTPYESLVHPEDLDTIRSARDRLHKAQEDHYSLTYRLRAASGEWRWIDDLTITMKDPVTGYLERRGLLIDITAKRDAETKVQQLSNYDVTTGLPNRTQILSLAAATLHSGQAQTVSFLVLDIDHFHRVNDSLGHEAGDQLLKRVGERLIAALPDGAIASRLSGDEFAIALMDTDSQQAHVYAADLYEALISSPIMIGDHELSVSGCFGIAVAGDVSSLSAELRNAQTAVGEAKKQTGERIAVYNIGLSEQRSALLTLESSLRRALKNDEIVLHYQPQIDSGTGRLVGAEALARWQHPDRGLLLPKDFIPFAEANGLIVELGSQVLRKACQQLSRWREQQHGPLSVAVNIAAPHFLQPSIISEVEDLLEEFDLPGSALELEITESMLLEPSDELLGHLETLSALGLRILIDDFGTGHSSMVYLRRLPIHGFKIDRSFLAHVPENERDMQILKPILRLGQALNLDVIAEGIERTEQARWLHKHNITCWQGNLISKPIEPEQFAARFFDTEKVRSQIVSITRVA